MNTRKFLFAVLIMMSMFTLSACGQQNDQPEAHTHEWGEWVVTTEPTETEYGVETRTCEKDNSHTETRQADKLPHTHEWGEWVVTTEPTETEYGIETRTCEKDNSHTETRPAYPTGTEGLEYYLMLDGTGYAVGKGTATATKIIIPTHHNRLPITYVSNGGFENFTILTDITFLTDDNVSYMIGIGFNAFDGCTSLTSITIPNGVTNIGFNAFFDCTALTSITIPNSVTSIGGWAFNGCTSLTSITIPIGVESIGYRAFFNCFNLTSITLPSGVTSIGDFAFYSCFTLTSITIPNGVTSIGDLTFYKCFNLTSITIPNGVTSIGTWAFDDCNKLTTINFTGTQEQWDAIPKDDAKIPTTATIIFDYVG